MDHHKPKTLLPENCTHSPYIHRIMCPECIADEIGPLVAQHDELKALVVAALNHVIEEEMDEELEGTSEH